MLYPLRSSLPAQCSVLVGQSETFLTSIRNLSAISQVDTPVLITGEPGTGKETCARMIHYLSRRAYNPFITVNCALMPRGPFEANAGMLFLENVDALSF